VLKYGLKERFLNGIAENKNRNLSEYRYGKKNTTYDLMHVLRTDVSWRVYRISFFPIRKMCWYYHLTVSLHQTFSLCRRQTREKPSISPNYDALA
jgi:hypothetical protein